MKNRVHLWVCLIFTVTFCLIAPAAAGELQFLTFPAVAPVTETSLSLPFTLPASTASAVSFRCSALMDTATGNRISPDRISLSYNQKTVGPNKLLTLTPQPTGGPEAGSTREFGLQINFLPSDPPGEYEGIIEAVLHHSTQDTERISLWVKTRVLPWIKLERVSGQPFPGFDSLSSLTESNLTITEPLKLLLASNTHWQLYLRVGTAIPHHDPEFPLQIRIGRPGKAGEEKKTLLANGPAQLVAAGPPTVVGDGLTPANYWTELYLSASIADWRQYPTGNHQLTFYLSGQTITP